MRTPLVSIFTRLRWSRLSWERMLPDPTDLDEDREDPPEPDPDELRDRYRED